MLAVLQLARGRMSDKPERVIVRMLRRFSDMIRSTLGLVVLFSLAGCTQPEPIVLRNPVTGELRQCRATVSAFVFPIAATADTSPAVRQCVMAYEAAGWWRLN